MSSMCHVTIIGRLTAEPEQKVPASGNAYTRLRLAWNHKKDEPGYIDATLFGKTGEIAATYLHKGSHVCIAGAKLQWSQYEKEGESSKRVSYSLVGGDLIMLGKKGDEDAPATTTATAAGDNDIPF
jgi:single stranded DNA-binding protein